MASKVPELADFREAAMMQFARDQLVLARAGLDENGDNSDSMHAMVRERCKHLANARAQRRAHRRPRPRRR